MDNVKRTDYVTRANVLKLLSDDEIARVSTAEMASQLNDGDEYVDLEAPDQGVLRALGKATESMGHVLPRKVLSDTTWRRVVVLLSAHQVEAAPHRS